MRKRVVLGAAFAFALLAAACAHKQRIPLEVSPPSATLYVDKEVQEFIPRELVLRSDRAHVLYFKSEGYRPVRVVIESVDVQGKARLSPQEVKVRLEPAARGGRSIQIETDEATADD